MIKKVCADQIIHPNAKLGASGIPNKENAATTAKGYTTIPPFVAAIVKLAAINAINIAPNGMLINSFTANVEI